MSSGFRSKHFSEVLIFMFMISQNFKEKTLTTYCIHLTQISYVYGFFFNFRSFEIINAISLEQSDRAQF